MATGLFRIGSTITELMRPQPPVWLSVGVVVLLTLQLSRSDAAARTYTLAELIDHALKHNESLDEARWKVRGAEAQLRQAKAAFVLPRLRLQSNNGLTPEAKGDAFNTTSDTSGLRPLGIFTQSQVEFVQPLYTFGQLASLRRAAAGGLAAERAELESARLQVSHQVQELYYGLLLAEDLQDLVQRLLDELEGRREELDDTVSLATTYKLEIALLQLETQAVGVENARVLAEKALAWQAGLEPDEAFELMDETLKPVAFERPPLDSLLVDAWSRPDWRRLQAGIAAKRALADAAHSRFFPQVYVAGGVRHAYAPNRTDQHNPFVKDDFNYFNFGAFLGVQQSFEWGLMGAEEDKARAEYLELRAKEATSVRGIALDVERAYLEAEQAETELRAAQKRRKLTRQWLKLAKEEYEFDPDEIKGLVTAFEAWAQAEQNYLEAIFHANMKTAELAKSVGRTSLND